MRKMTIGGEEIKVKPFVLKKGLEWDLVGEIRATVRTTVDHIVDIAEEIRDTQTGDWDCGPRHLPTYLGRFAPAQLAKAARTNEEWVERLNSEDTIRLILGTYAENEATYKRIFDEEFSPEIKDPLDLPFSEVKAKLAIYGYSDNDILNMTFEEMAGLYRDLAETDLRKRETFLRIMKEILETPYIETLTK